MRTLGLLAATLVVFASTVAAEPWLDKQNIFSAGEGGYDVYRIPGIAVTAEGTVIAY